MPPAGKLLNYAGRLVILWLLVSLWPLSAAAGPDPKDNILIFWTENERLKAVSLMSAQNYGEPVGIVAIPVFIRVRCGSGDSAVVTISEAYSRLGRQGLTAILEELFQVPIGGYLTMDQSTLKKASDIVGPVVMENKLTTMVDIFEGNYTSGVIDPQSEIRHLAAALVEPRVLIKAPKVVRIIITEVNTNLGLTNIWHIYRAIEERGPGILQKKALTGRDYFVGNSRYRDVSPEDWVSVLSEVKGV